MKYGKLIVVDGPDGSGKTRFARDLHSGLRCDGLDDRVILMQMPYRLDTYRAIMDGNNILPIDLLDIIAHDFDRARKDLIEPARSAGLTVVCDRWIDSTYVYQGILGPLGVDYVKSRLWRGSTEPWPDYSVRMTTTLDICLANITKRTHNDANDTVDRVTAAHAAYLSLPNLAYCRGRQYVDCRDIAYRDSDGFFALIKDIIADVKSGEDQ